MNKIKYITALLAGFMVMFSSCVKDLDTEPIDPDVVTAASVYEDPASYEQVLAKLYAGLAVSGQQGPAGQGDIQGIDEGFGQYLRGYWYMQELTTDEAVIAWNDQTIKDLHWQTWGSSDVFITAFYYRIFYQIAVCNEYLRETSDDKLSDRGVSGQLYDDIQVFRAEARFLRALSYWHAMDLFANPPFVTEDDPVGSFLPPQTNRSVLFSYVESELRAIETLMKEPRANLYGRADRAAAWMVLAKLYMNAEVYIGEDRYGDALEYCDRIIGAGYALETDYAGLFLADNHTNVNEVIFAIPFDGLSTQTFGGTNFIIHAAIGGSMVPGDFGFSGGWGGTRTTSAFVSYFDDISGDTDVRAMFHTDGQNLEIEDIGLFTDGYAITKWRNVDSNGNPGVDPEFPDTDFPMFRYADVLLMKAECLYRTGGGGALALINQVRERAGATALSGSVTDEILIAERARELYWECHRRTDLIRFGVFTTDGYLWDWKGNVKEGKATDPKFNIFPIPSADIGANPNLQQNPGY
jgi:hypothetical protein